jgi:hypothetical protein
MKKLFLLFFLAANLSAIRTSAQQVVNGDTSYVPGAFLGTQVPNAASTGTTLNSIAKLTGAGTAVISGPADTSGMIGIVGTGAGITGNATIAQVGQVQCHFDGSTTANDYVTNSPTVAGDCSDGGSTSPTTTQTIGRVLSTNVGAGLYTIALSLGGSSSSGGSTALLSSNNIWTANNAFKGTDPWADVKAFGARSSGTTVFPYAFATCTNGGSATTLSLSAPSFINGDGISVRNCGPTWNGGMSAAPTVSAPTVTPTLAVTGTVPDAPSFESVNSPTGSSTYCYKVIARDQVGGLTTPSAATCISTGLATLGLGAPLTVVSMTRSNSGVTVNTSGTQNLAIGAMVHLYGMSNAQFEGYFNVATVNNAGNSFTLANTPMDTRQGAAASATGGFVSYGPANQIKWTVVSGAWQYYLCGKRPGDGSYSRIGTSMPTGQTGGQYTITSYYDFGATMNGNQTYPLYVTDAYCNSGTGLFDPLTTTVVSGGGTSTIVLNDASSQNVSGALALYDAAPNILAAIKSIGYTTPSFIGGSIYLPPVPTNGQVYGYPINSYLKIPSNIKVIQAGPLILNETVELGSNTNWDGGWAVGPSPGEFSLSANAFTLCQYANPCFYSNNALNGLYQNMTIQTNGANGSNIWMMDDIYNITFRNVSFDTNQDASTDFVGKALVVRSTQSVGATVFIEDSSFGNGPSSANDSTWSSTIYIPIALNSSQATVTSTSTMEMKNVAMQLRGIAWNLAGGAYDFHFDRGHRQGGVNPFLVLGNYSGTPGGFVDIRHLLLDSEIQPVVANLTSIPVSDPNTVYVTLKDVASGTADVGGRPPIISGTAPYTVIYDQSGTTLTQGIGVETHDQNGASAGVVNANYQFQCPEHTTPPSGIANFDILYCDATAHAFKIINNNGAAVSLGNISGTAANNQVIVGSGVGTIGSSSAFTFDGTTLTTTGTGGLSLLQGRFTETTIPAAAAGKDVCYGDSSAHALECSNNNGSFYIVALINGATTIGNCPQFAAGPTIVDSGATCGGGSGGANTALSNLAGVGINTTLLPGSVNTVALASNALPFTNLFIGTAANSAFSFGYTLTANRSVNIPDANSTTVQNCASVANQFVTQILQATGVCTKAQPTLTNVAAGTAGTGTYDFSGITLGKWRLSAGLTTTVNGDFGYDTTNKNWHSWQNGADNIVGVFDGTQVNGDCVKALIAASVVNLSDLGVCATSSSSNTFTNKTMNAEGTGNTLSVPAKSVFPAAGCSAGSVAGPALVTGSTNTPTPQCVGTTVPKGVLSFARGNAAYISSFQLPSDWNSSASTDIQVCFTTTDTTNAHVTSFNIQTGFNITDGTATDDPALNALQAASVTTGASQVSGGQLCATKTALTMTGAVAGYNMEVSIVRNNSGTDTNTDTAVAVKYVTLTYGRSMNASNR